jgi:cell shape-determining protein MreC
MRNVFLVMAGFGVGLSLFFFASFKTKNTVAPRQYVVIDALESMVSGGIGRSKGVITYSDGKQEEFELENFYSMAA